MTNLLNTFLNTSIGFDPFFDGRENWYKAKSSYPFYNIKKESENKYIIEIALAGFAKEDIDIHQTDEILTIEASEHVKEEEAVYISKGISKRWFRKQFQLADTVEVKKVKLENGMLYIHLENNRPSKEKTFDID
jgi:molecular chaperone IbpA